MILNDRVGLSPAEVKELIDYIAENNSWYSMENAELGRRLPKYYAMQFDTRTNDMWSIRFWDIINRHPWDPREVIFQTGMGYNLKAKIYGWLEEVL